VSRGRPTNATQLHSYTVITRAEVFTPSEAFTPCEVQCNNGRATKYNGHKDHATKTVDTQTDRNTEDECHSGQPRLSADSTTHLLSVPKVPKV